MKLANKSIAIILGVFLASTVTAAEDKEQAAFVNFQNGEAITKSEFDIYINRRIDLKPTVRNFAGAKAALDEMAMARALNLEGAALKIPKISGEETEKFNDIYAHAVYQKLIPACPAPKDAAEQRSFYDRNPAAFTVPASVRLSRIILPKSVKIENEAAGMWLFNQVQLMSAGKTQLDDVVKKADQAYQIDPQGDLGWVALEGGDNQIFRALASANEGDLVGPVAEGNFVYLFQINGKKPAAILPWEQAATFVEKRAASYCRQQEHQKLHDSLFKKYGIQIVEKQIEELFKINKN